MRASKGCQACRTRHTKCTKKKDQSVCTRCQENNQECIFDSKWRFKHVAHVDTASQGIRSRTRLAYDADQPWVSSRKIAKFVLESGDAMDIDVLEAFGCQDNDEDADERALIELNRDVYGTQVDNVTTSAAQGPSMNGFVNPPTDLQRTEDSFANQASTVLKPDSGDRPSTDLQDSDCPPPLLFEYGGPDTDPVNDSLENLELGPERCSFEDLNSGISPTRTLENPVCFTACLSHREVLLMQHFIHKLSPWLDVCDITARFANEVPVRAMNSPMLLYAVLAISAGHQAGSDEDRHEASEYHGKCLELVIPALSQPERCFDDILLATIVCLRCYEEFNTQADDYLHLNGTARLLSAIPHFSHSGGLAESASWQALRQDIYVSLIQKQPPTFELDNYDKSSVFNSLDFGAAANVIILLFAKILRCLYSSECNNNYTIWQGLEVAVDQWNVQRVFQPSYYQDAQAESGKPFPTICMISAPQVVALQYYYACKVYLRLHRPVSHHRAGFEATREQRRAERDINTSLCSIIGLAQSNVWVENANFTACHILTTCNVAPHTEQDAMLIRTGGYCISDSIQREQSLAFLRRVKGIMGWDTQHTIDTLQHQWDDLDILVP